MADPGAAGAAMAAGQNPATKLLELRRQMFVVQKGLEEGKHTALLQEAAFRAKEEAVRTRDLELQATFIKMDAVVKENDAKKDRAQRRAADEKRTAAQKAREIDDGEASIAELREEVAALEKAKAKLQKQHDFLAAYQASNHQEFPDIGAILERYRTLRAAQRDLLAEQSRLLEEVEHSRRELSRKQKARSTHALNAENITGQIRDRIEATRALSLKLFQGADEAIVARGAKVSELGTALQSVGNLYGRCVTGPYGGTIKHHPGDADVLGFGAGNLGADVVGDVGGSSEGKEAEGGGGGGGGGGSGGSAKEDAAAAAAAHAAAARSAGGGASVEEITGMAPAAVVAKMRKAMSGLIVVGSYLVDYDAILRERGEWLAEQRRLAEEKEAANAAAAAEEAEKVRAKAQRAAAAAAKASGGGGGGGSGSPRKTAAAAAPAAAAAAGSPPPFSPMKSGGAGGGLAGSSSGLDGSSSGAMLGGSSSLLGGGAAGSSVPGAAAAAAKELLAAAAAGGVPGLGPRLATVLGRQGVKAYVVAENVRLPAKIAAQVSTSMLSPKTIAMLQGRSEAAGGGARGGGGGGGMGASSSAAAGASRRDDEAASVSGSTGGGKRD